MPTRVDLTNYELDLEQAIEEAAAKLRDGKLLVLPTETVYGIAAKLDTEAGQNAVRELRVGSNVTTPLTPHLASREEAMQFLGDLSEVGERLLTKLWPGPVGLIFEVPADRRGEVAETFGVDEGDLFDAAGKVVLRCPDDLFTNAVLRRVGQPVVVTRIGLPRGADATRAPADEEVPASIDTIYDGGPTRFAKPSTVVKVFGDDADQWEVVREGIYDSRIVERLLRTTVLFVCSGNTCRSPMAMALARKIIADRLGVEQDGLEAAGWDVISAGTHAMEGMRATPAGADAMRTMGADLSSHRSQPLSVGLINRSDLVVTMGQSHRQTVLAMVPSAAEKTVQLDPDQDIEDPIGASPQHYQELAKTIEKLVSDRLNESLLAESEQST